MNGEEYIKLARKKAKEALVFLGKVERDVFRFLEWNVTEKKIEELKKSKKSLFAEVKQKAEEYFNKIDEYLTPELANIEEQVYNTLAKVKQKLFNIIKS